MPHGSPPPLSPSPRARWCLALALAASTTLLPRPGSAQVRVAVYELALSGELEGAAEDPILGALASGLRPAASHVVSPAEAGRLLAAEAEPPDRAGPGWARHAGLALDADALIQVRVDQLEQHYRVEAEMRLARDGSRLAATTLECAACTWDEALETVARAGRALAAALPGRLTIEVSPEGASVTVDGARVEPGEAISLPPGSHRVEARHPGRGAESREVVVVAGGSTSLSLDLAPPRALGQPAPGGAQPEGARPLWIGAWTTAGAALAALVPGIVWLALDGRCPIDWDPDAGTCPEVYNLWPQGLTLTAIGAALLSASVTLFAVDWFTRRRRAPRSRILVGPTGFARGGGGVHLLAWF